MKQVLSILKMASKYAAIGVIVVEILDFLIPKVEEISDLVSGKSVPKLKPKPSFTNEVISEQPSKPWVTEQQSGEPETDGHQLAGEDTGQ